MSDEDVLGAMTDDAIAAFNRGDAKAYAAMYAADADNIDSFGRTFKSRDQIEQAYAELFAGPYRGARLTTQVDNLRFVTPTVAVSDITAEFVMPDATSRKLKGVSVARKQDDKWAVVALRTWLASPAGK